MSVPPFVRCSGIRMPAAKALNGVYEYQGVIGNRPVYHQIGVSSGNLLWFVDIAMGGPCWVVSPKSQGVMRCPDEVVARSSSVALWPWEAGGWEVCNGLGGFAPCCGDDSAGMLRFVPSIPAAELLVSVPGPDDEDGPYSAVAYKWSGEVNDRLAFRRANASGDKAAEMRLFFAKGRKRWLLAKLRPEGAGIDTMVARSLPDDGASWASFWPWAMDAGGWETTQTPTLGMDDGEAIFVTNPHAHVKLSSPAVQVMGAAAASVALEGVFEPRGMANGRVHYVTNPEDASCLEGAGPLCLWHDDERGQWVITTAEQLGDTRAALARIASRAWWPWEAHLCGSTSPSTLGAAALSAAPPWQSGNAMLKDARRCWEVADRGGAFAEARGMSVEMIFPKRAEVVSGKKATHEFLGTFTCSGLLSSRPFFTQAKKRDEGRGCHVLWYAEESNQWVITADFRFLNTSSVDARVGDSAWFPWDVDIPWEVSDGLGDFIQDPRLKVIVAEVQGSRSASPSNSKPPSRQPSP